MRLLAAVLLLPLAGLLSTQAEAQAHTTAQPQATRQNQGQASPAARPFGTGTRSRLPPGTTRPPAAPGQTPARLTEPAPIPNRDIEAPRDRFANSLNPSLEPMILQPDRRQGLTFGGEHLRETGPDRPFDNIVPGARLRIPTQ
jgi:hypothetical protein